MSAPRANRTTWNWLTDTYWYVLPPDLPALELDPATARLGWLVDQTVWHVSGYANGYFWGVTAALVADAGETPPARGLGSRPRQLALLGIVTPDGHVQITFLPVGGSRGNTTIGFGRVVRAGDGWVFEMQMSTDRGGERMLHWANMAQTREGDPSWDHLPGFDVSVPEMLHGAVYPQLDVQTPDET